jgi:hypothetical protein
MDRHRDTFSHAQVGHQAHKDLPWRQFWKAKPNEFCKENYYTYIPNPLQRVHPIASVIINPSGDNFSRLTTSTSTGFCLDEAEKLLMTPEPL